MAAANLNPPQRVRMPRESLGRSSANCIDASVLFASLFENLGMEPMVVLVPGHSYVGVRVARHSLRFLLIDTALTGRMGFEAAAQSAARALRKYSPGQPPVSTLPKPDRPVFTPCL